MLSRRLSSGCAAWVSLEVLLLLCDWIYIKQCQQFAISRYQRNRICMVYGSLRKMKSVLDIRFCEHDHVRFVLVSTSLCVLDVCDVPLSACLHALAVCDVSVSWVCTCERRRCARFLGPRRIPVALEAVVAVGAQEVRCGRSFKPRARRRRAFCTFAASPVSLVRAVRLTRCTRGKNV